jgi:hypothetical protein
MFFSTMLWKEGFLLEIITIIQRCIQQLVREPTFHIVFLKTCPVLRFFYEMSVAEMSG